MILRRLIRYIIRSIDELIYLSATNLFNILYFINMTHNVHNDIRSYAGGASSLRFSVFSLIFSKYKLNTMSSAMTKLI